MIVMLQKIDERLSFPDVDDESIEILELGAMRKPIDMNGTMAEFYFLDGVWFTQDMTE